MQQRRQPRPAKFWAWRPPSSVISRSDTAALPKVRTGLPTNSIELERLGGVAQPRDVRNADFSSMLRSQVFTAKPHARRTPTAETASPRYALLLNELPTLPQRPSEKSVTSVCKKLCRVSRYIHTVEVERPDGSPKVNFAVLLLLRSEELGRTAHMGAQPTHGSVQDSHSSRS